MKFAEYLRSTEYADIQPKNKDELVEIIKSTISEEGNKCDLNFIDTSLIKDMSSLFSDKYGLESFNGDISKWDVSNVESMYEMFSESRFNQDISRWDVSNVKDMSIMFFRAKEFNSDISNWDVSNVTDMDGMFMRASSFNQDISSWDVSSVEDMEYMFYNAASFNQDISSWDVSNVEDMFSMFSESAFNQDISDWDISNVKNTKYMFTGTKIKDEYKPQLKTNESRYSRSPTESRNRIQTSNQIDISLRDICEMLMVALILISILIV